jgi:hypothetical protein
MAIASISSTMAAYKAGPDYFTTENLLALATLKKRWGAGIT